MGDTSVAEEHSDYEDAIDHENLLEAIRELNESLTMWKIIVVVMALLLALSWLYIAYIWVSERSRSGKKRPSVRGIKMKSVPRFSVRINGPESDQDPDVELGEKPRTSLTRKSRGSRASRSRQSRRHRSRRSRRSGVSRSRTDFVRAFKDNLMTKVSNRLS